MQQKKLAGRSFLSKLGLAGSGACKPQWEFEGSTLEQFFHIVLRLNGALILQLKQHIKASVTIIARYVFFYQHCSTKTQKHNVLMENMTNTIGKKHTHFGKNKSTPRYHNIRQECGFTQNVAFFCISLCFPTPLLCEYWLGGQTRVS